MLFGCYRRADAADPDIYIAAVAVVLSLYDTDLIREVTDPRTGIQTTEKHMTFMPNAGELKVYCEALAARKERFKRLGDLPRPDFTQRCLPQLEPRPGDLAQIFVPKDNRRYASLVEWSKTANPRFWRFGKASDGREGIWIDTNTWDATPSTTRSLGEAAKSVQQQFKLSEAALKAMRERDEVRAMSQGEAAE